MMKKYIIEIEEPEDCQSCQLCRSDNWGNEMECCLTDEINMSEFAYYKEISKDCPLKNK